MKIIVACSFIVAILLSAPSFANPPAGVGGQGKGNTGVGSVTKGVVPPGLQNKAIPQGLQMQNKTPTGWTKGKKKGWNKQQKTFKPNPIPIQ